MERDFHTLYSSGIKCSVSVGNTQQKNTMIRRHCLSMEKGLQSERNQRFCFRFKTSYNLMILLEYFTHRSKMSTTLCSTCAIVEVRLRERNQSPSTISQFTVSILMTTARPFSKPDLYQNHVARVASTGVKRDGIFRSIRRVKFKFVTTIRVSL